MAIATVKVGNDVVYQADIKTLVMNALITANVYQAYKILAKGTLKIQLGSGHKELMPLLTQNDKDFSL